MLRIGNFDVEGLTQNCIVDTISPRFSFYFESDKDDSHIVSATLSLNNGWSKKVTEQINVPYDGDSLFPETTYLASLKVIDNHGEEAKSSLSFFTTKLGTSFKGKWISDGSYDFMEKKVSPKVMTFFKDINITKPLKKAYLHSTALGIYRIDINGRKISNTFFAPGFTSYKTNLQYQTNEVSSLLQRGVNSLLVNVAGGWAVGSFVFTRVNRYYAKRQAFLMDLHLIYEDGSEETVCSDTSFKVSEDGPYKMADFYDGETYDSRIDYAKLSLKSATEENIGIKPSLLGGYNSPVIITKYLLPKKTIPKKNQVIYDFNQNFAGIVSLHIKKAQAGQKIVIHHAEILDKEGNLDLSLLRSAKATVTYICHEGLQDYLPEFTYMGFRYISIEGIPEEDIEVKAGVLSSDIKETGSFKCSNPDLNRLNENILWSARSNFMDIPTDCPQRDERMGWTGDISIFAPTGCFDFNLRRFLIKWLKDVKAEQLKTGGIPNTVPAHGYKFPATMPKMAVDFWGDACLTVPYELYIQYGDEDILEYMYPTMKKYVNACKFWANIWGVGKYRYIWHTPAMLHFGDWVAPDVDKMASWQKRSCYTATASLRRTSLLLSKIAKILNKTEDEKKYSLLSKKVASSYVSVFTDGEGRLKKEQFQTGYVLPLAFDMFNAKEKEEALHQLVSLIEKNHYRIGTGFPGTPFILFVLADNGYSDVAYKMLLNTESPSWLYNVKAGGTTIWEKFDGMLPDGTCRPSKDGTGNMISFNHYASGSVGQFLYQRIGGLEPLDAGYKVFKIKPILGGGITSCQITTTVPYGRISSSWTIKDKHFEIQLEVPMNTKCLLTLPDNSSREVLSGKYTFACDIR